MEPRPTETFEEYEARVLRERHELEIVHARPAAGPSPRRNVKATRAARRRVKASRKANRR